MRATHRGSRLWPAGIIGPILITVLLIVQGLLQPDYSHVSMPVSALALWPLGWLQNLSFAVFAVLLAAFTIGLHRAVEETRYGRLGPALMLASAVGTVLVAAFPWYRAGGIVVESSEHALGAITAFVGAGAGLVAFARRMRADPRWRDLSAYVLVAVWFVCLVVISLRMRRADKLAPLESTSSHQ